MDFNKIVMHGYTWLTSDSANVNLYTQFKLSMFYHCAAVLLMLVMFMECSGIEYHITPSPSDPCPAQSCVTFSQFAANTSSYLHSNTKLIFLPGNHSLDSELRIDSVISLIYLNSNFHQIVRINCGKLSRLDLCNITTVHISRLEFIGCGGNRVESISHLLIEDTSFQGQDDSSTALEFVGTTAVIERSVFISNSVGNLKNIGINMWEKGSKPFHSLAGGAVIVTHSFITIIGSTFEDNNAQVGGAIFGELGSNIIIINSTFVGNHVASHNNYSDSYGGALYAQSGCTLEIYNSVFNNNTVFNNNAVISDHVKAVRAGGGIAVVDRAEVYIGGSEFSHNFAQDGGAIAVWEVTMYIEDTEFNNNEASWMGGAIHMEGKSTTNIDRNRFSNNKAFSNGAIRARGHYLGVININGSQFNNNRADESGGALGITESFLYIDMCMFNHNKLSKTGDSDGGVMFLREVLVKVNTTCFFNNEADRRGGAIYAVWCTVTINNCHSYFRNNEAYLSGGAIFTWDYTVHINRCEFSDNKAGHGGAMALDLIEAVNISGSMFRDNEEMVMVKRSIFVLPVIEVF